MSSNKYNKIISCKNKIRTNKNLRKIRKKAKINKNKLNNNTLTNLMTVQSRRVMLCSWML